MAMPFIEFFFALLPFLIAWLIHLFLGDLAETYQLLPFAGAIQQAGQQDLIDRLTDKGVHLIFWLPNCTSKMQTSDVSIFQPFKNKLHTLRRAMMRLKGYGYASKQGR